MLTFSPYFSLLINLRLIYYLEEKGEMTITEIMGGADISVHHLYVSIEKALQLKLIKKTIDTTSYPNRNSISLTRRGKELSTKLEEITGLLSPE